ncbi:MAG: glycogen debranching protein GlgX [Desulfuromonadales bacterium]|nr:glycogen debranching protein GlgX [Desulfuromonadales bacterium]
MSKPAKNGSIRCGRGRPLPFGVTRDGQGHNFALFSRHASRVELLIYAVGQKQPLFTIDFDPHENRTGDVWHVRLDNLPGGFEYAYRLDRIIQDEQSPLHRFDPDCLLVDPYARLLRGPSLWRGAAREDAVAGGWRGLVVADRFDWENDQPPRHHLADSVIYELHLRGFTRHPTAGVAAPGTCRALIEKIPYLQQLGVTAVELLPVTAFNEADNYRKNPETGEALHNFWGYHPLNFFAIQAAYAENRDPGSERDEFRQMVKALHTAGIEVILDVVFNHTGEGDERGCTLSFRGLDNSVYYLLDSDGRYLNYSGCGNTVNCNHPVVRDLIVDALCYWVTEMHVDGFRFDLAAILGRGADGEPLANPPLIERIAAHPVLADTKLIAEAWDAAGLYQVGTFPNFGRWAEWNGQFRDDIRRFVRGDAGMVPRLATRLAGSADLYQHGGRAPYHSINFITCHDGFTLADLVSYRDKHNLANGEFNADGAADNYSANHGVEGATDDPRINALRQRQMRNLLTLLLLAHGVPMLLAGDEMGRSQQGNNNAWCQDNELGWIDWSDLQRHTGLHQFVRKLIALRKRYALLRPRHFEGAERGERTLSWHGRRAGKPDWSEQSHSLGMLLSGLQGDEEIFLFAHAGQQSLEIELPAGDRRRPWLLAVDTGLEDTPIVEPGNECELVDQQQYYRLRDRSVLVLVKAGLQKK